MMMPTGARRVELLGNFGADSQLLSYAEDEARGTEHDGGPEGGGGLGAVVLDLLEVRGAAAVLGVLALGLGAGGRGVCVHERQKLVADRRQASSNDTSSTKPVKLTDCLMAVQARLKAAAAMRGMRRATKCHTLMMMAKIMCC